MITATTGLLLSSIRAYPVALTVHSRSTLRVIIVCLFAWSLIPYKKWLDLKVNFRGPTVAY